MVQDSMKDDDEDDDDSVDENDPDLLVSITISCSVNIFGTLCQVIHLIPFECDRRYIIVILLQGELNELTGDNEESDEPQPSPEEEKPAPSATALLSLLEERLKMYQAAEANAKSTGETSRARRFVMCRLLRIPMLLN